MKILIVMAVLASSLIASDIPETQILKENPFNGIQYEHVKVGETQTYSRFRTFYKWRYITVYNEHKVEQVMQDVPRFEELCHDQGNRVASWNFRKSISREIQMGASFTLLGFLGVDLGGSISNSFSISITRWIQAQLGVHALHTPVLKSKELRGMTYIQRYYPNTDSFENVAIANDEFLVTHLEPIFSARREIIGSCED